MVEEESIPLVWTLDCMAEREGFEPAVFCYFTKGYEAIVSRSRLTVEQKSGEFGYLIAL